MGAVGYLARGLKPADSGPNDEVFQYLPATEV